MRQAPDGADTRGLEELLDVLRVSDQRESYERGIEQEQAAGRPVAVLVNALADLPGVTGLEALRASRRVVELLTAARWHLMRQAREEGSSWSQVGSALGMSKQAAYDFYRRKLDQQDESVTPDSDEVARSRAALDEKSNG
ncbi:hypothetical protein [Kribbella jiaozuonensis]|uniref:Homeodomain-like domain-containing protein n=1 Tax=Kribbella jiaozuonensis TaxID=2575441 RepID=A0A4V5UW98_9ACTN|nr:hypothetical protein [Kribbella jiaozuonensis]TKK76173.1 hypothetical protein FDA38_27560 [Kribbella jiaozuonensis]